MKRHASLLPWRKGSLLPVEVQKSIYDAASLSRVSITQRGTLNRTIELLAPLPPNLAPNAEREIRELWSYAQRQQPLHPKRLLLLTPETTLFKWPSVAPLFFGYIDGRIRQRALERTSHLPPGGFFLGLLLWRLNDWAAPVREAAEACLTRCLPQIPPEDLRAALPLMTLRMPSWARGADTGRALPRLLQQGRGLEALRDALMAGHTGPLPRMFKQALKTDLLDRDLPTLARDARHPQVREHAARCLLEGKARWWVGRSWEWVDKSMGETREFSVFDSRPVPAPPDRAALIRNCATDRLPGLRKLAADRLIAGDCPALLAELLPALAADRNTAVRDRANFLSRKHS
ncbi:hypothetical protein [Aliiroseovarius sp.]|uniref:hypothetical protein n=1 Tax=Aliiroseovarius sp. TaxID=1872442 RepID=UPI003BA9B853